MNKIIELYGLLVGLAGVISLTYFLIRTTGRCLPYEPILWARITEIIMGLSATIILGKVIKDKLR